MNTKIKAIAVISLILLSAIGAIAGNISLGEQDIAITSTTTVEITSPAEGRHVLGTSATISYTISGTDLINYTLDNGITWTGADGTDIVVSGIVGSEVPIAVEFVNATDGISLATRSFVIDDQAPAEVTNLTATSVTAQTITWDWDNPTTTDFNNTLITVTKGGLPVGIYDQYFLAGTETSIHITGLLSNTEYVITVQTEDGST